MSLYRQKQVLKSQILDTERLMELVAGHPLMSESLSHKLTKLEEELAYLANEDSEPKITLLFSGNAVKGSLGIKSSFLSKTLTPFENLIKTQFAFRRFSRAYQSGQKRKLEINRAELFLTSLPTGSFGVELSKLDTSDLFDNLDVSDAMKDVINLVKNASKEDEVFEQAIENTTSKSLNNLKTFLSNIASEQSTLTLESGEIGVELSKDDVVKTFNRISLTTSSEEEIVINGIFRGLLLDSFKFEIQDVEQKKITGFLNEDLNEDLLVEYNKAYLNQYCQIHLQINETEFKTGKKRKSYELLGIYPIN